MAIEGYTELVKIAEYGFKNKPEKVKGYMELFLKKFPNNQLSKPFKCILNNDNGCLIMCEDEHIETCSECNKRMTLVRPGKYQCDNPKCKLNIIQT